MDHLENHLKVLPTGRATHSSLCAAKDIKLSEKSATEKNIVHNASQYM